VFRAFDQFKLFLGPARLRALFLLIAITGVTSLILNALSTAENPWIPTAQTILALIALVGAAVIIAGRMDSLERRRWIAILLPAFGAVLLALTVLPQFSLALLGGAVGWVVMGALLFRPKTPVGVRAAVKLLRKGDIEGAVKEMDGVIKDDPDDANHFRFRAELLRLNGKLDRARRDYMRILELEPDSAGAYNGLAEVGLQAGNFERALEAAQKAAALVPEDWVAFYNLGMIEDRLAHSDSAITNLQQALALKVPEVRHRALIHLYLTRAYARKGDFAAAETELTRLQKASGGLEEWQQILEHEQAATLRQVLGDDVKTADDLLKKTLAVTELHNVRTTQS
jgi:Flp pilus assembly protein TadD